MANTISDNKIKKYLRIGIHYHANNYYRKKKSYSTRSILTDFQDFDHSSFSIDNFSELTNIYEVPPHNFEDYFDNEQLINTIKTLSPKEKKFIFEKFIVKKVIQNLLENETYLNKLFQYTKKDYYKK